MKFLHTGTGLKLMPGVVALIQTFGDRINFHPHIHVLMTEGGTAPDGAFHRVGRFHDESLQEVFTHDVFSLLLRKKLIGLPLVQKILHWRHTGFNVHSKVRAQSTSEAERVGKYMIRPLLSLKRLFFDETPGRVRYQYSRYGSQEESMDYLEFIARVTSHKPNKGQIMIRCYGLYSNAQRGKIHKVGADPLYPPIIEDDPTYVPSKGWAEMIRKVYEVDLPPLSFMWGPDENRILFRRTENHRQDHPSSGADIRGRTAAASPSCPAGTPDGSRGEWAKGAVYLKLYGLEISGNLCL